MENQQNTQKTVDDQNRFGRNILLGALYTAIVASGTLIATSVYQNHLCSKKTSVLENEVVQLTQDNYLADSVNKANLASFQNYISNDSLSTDSLAIDSTGLVSIVSKIEEDSVDTWSQVPNFGNEQKVADQKPAGNKPSKPSISSQKPKTYTMEDILGKDAKYITGVYYTSDSTSQGYAILAPSENLTVKELDAYTKEAIATKYNVNSNTIDSFSYNSEIPVPKDLKGVDLINITVYKGVIIDPNHPDFELVEQETDTVNIASFFENVGDTTSKISNYNNACKVKPVSKTAIYDPASGKTYKANYLGDNKKN